MVYDTFLICLNRGGEKPTQAIRKLWPDNQHFHLTNTEFSPLPEGTAEVFAVAVERTNGPTLVSNVYERIKEEVGDHFHSLIVPLSGTVFGFNRNDLWEWVRKVTS